MKKTILIISLVFSFLSSNDQTENKSTVLKINDLTFIEGKWKAIAKDSSFSSILEYKFSPQSRLLFATNHLYGKDGKVFGIYEGAYLLDVDKIIYILSGPKGETHQGTALIAKDTVTHLARINPGKSIKTYKSQMILKDNQLFYYANYSRESEIPNQLEYTNPLIYVRLKE
jgi:hypothetical protein